MRRLVPLAATGLILVLAACGGTASSPTATTPPAASQPPASEPAASEPAGSTAAACAPSSEDPAVQASIRDFTFSPDPVEASVGDVVAWTNSDEAPHSVVVAAGCRTDTLRDGQMGALVFTAAGSYSYVCGIHPNMTGTIEISD